MSAEPHAKHTSTRTYLLIWAALIVLTLSTAGAAALPLKEWGLDAWHTPIGLLIAVVKAVLIVLFFMHALESGRLVWMVIAVSILFLAILGSITFSDYATRRMDDGIRDPGGRSSLITPAR